MKNNGVVEWVQKGHQWRGRGQPRFEFSRSAFGNPDKREIIPRGRVSNKEIFSLWLQAYSALLIIRPVLVMPTVTAWQHIYSNVEASDSPSNKGGFQTLFYSHEGLSQEDVRHIEKRVFYLTGGHQTNKTRFFHSSSRAHCIRDGCTA